MGDRPSSVERMGLDCVSTLGGRKVTCGLSPLRKAQPGPLLLQRPRLSKVLTWL